MTSIRLPCDFDSRISTCAPRPAIRIPLTRALPAMGFPLLGRTPGEAVTAVRGWYERSGQARHGPGTIEWGRCPVNVAG